MCARRLVHRLKSTLPSQALAVIALRKSAKGSPPGPIQAGSGPQTRYFSWFDTVWNVLVNLVPRVVIAEVAATAIRAAMRPYSIAVAPDSSVAKRVKSVFMAGSCPILFALWRLAHELDWTELRPLTRNDG